MNNGGFRCLIGMKPMFWILRPFVLERQVFDHHSIIFGLACSLTTKYFPFFLFFCSVSLEPSSCSSFARPKAHLSMDLGQEVSR